MLPYLGTIQFQVQLVIPMFYYTSTALIKIHDKNQITALRDGGFGSLTMVVPEGKASINIIYEMTLTQITSRNTKKHVCNENNDSNLQICFAKYTERVIGCKLPWLNTTSLGRKLHN